MKRRGYFSPVIIRGEEDRAIGIWHNVKLVPPIKRTNISEIVEGLSTADKWFKAKLMYITIDEKTGKEKKQAVHFIVRASDINNAHICVVEHMKGSVMDYEIATLDETKIMDLFRYKVNTSDNG
ncbi:DUF4494 family protein [Prevotellamassilia timonensis]|uniref:DUF4494 family protein n=1 Tax=Prevotellamassilia timonensis TaxID=1852370 RepID=UPI00307934BB